MDESKYAQEALTGLPREKLRRMLGEDLRKELSADDALVRRLLAELQRRGSDPAFTDDASVEAACEKFRLGVEAPKKRWYQRPVLKVAPVVLALGILFFALPGVAEADPVPDVLGWWSDSVFQFIRPGKQPNVQEYVFTTDHPGLQQIYDTGTELGIHEQIIPRKLSLEYQLSDLKTIQLSDSTSTYSQLASKANKIL